MNRYLIFDENSKLEDFLKGFLIESETDVEIATVSDLNNAMNSILKKSPSVVFFNIDLLPSPIYFIKELSFIQNSLPYFIAVSTTKDLAYDAFKAGFNDYLLKPFDEVEFRKSLAKKKQLSKTELNLETICLKSYNDYQYLNTSDIIFLKADNNTTDFHLSNGEIVVAFKTLKTFEGLLPNNFIRIHKSYIVNKDYISKIQIGKLNCVLNDKAHHSIPFTRTYLDNIEFLINSFSSSTIFNRN